MRRRFSTATLGAQAVKPPKLTQPSSELSAEKVTKENKPMPKTNYLKFRNETSLKDALYNLHPSSGATVEYCIGLTVGIVASMQAQGLTFRQGIDVIACYCPENSRLAVPGSWLIELQAALLARGKKWKQEESTNAKS